MSFLDARPAFQCEINLGESARVKIQFPARGLFRDTGRFKVDVEIAGGVRRYIQERLVGSVRPAALTTIKTRIQPFWLT